MTLGFSLLSPQNGLFPAWQDVIFPFPVRSCQVPSTNAGEDGISDGVMIPRSGKRERPRLCRRGRQRPRDQRLHRSEKNGDTTTRKPMPTLPPPGGLWKREAQRTYDGSSPSAPPRSTRAEIHPPPSRKLPRGFLGTPAAVRAADTNAA